MPTTIQIKRGNASTLPLLLAGEPAFVLDNKAMYIGNGTTNTLIGGEGLGTIKTVLNTPQTGGTNTLTRYLLSGHTPLSNTTPTALDLRTTVLSATNQFGKDSVALGSATQAQGDYAFACGSNASASANYSCACGGNASASANYAFACCAAFASGIYSHASGTAAAIGQYSSASGYQTSAAGNYTLATGYSTTAQGGYSIAAGYNTSAQGGYSVAAGHSTLAQGEASCAFCIASNANTYASFVMGQYNKITAGSATAYSATQNALMIGNGISSGNRTNCFRVVFDGSVYGLSAFNSSGADYAEYFEWSDGNPSKVDRVGLFVKVSRDSDKIDIASDTPMSDILGVVSHTGAVIGNAHSEVWSNMHIKDDFGRTIYDTSTDKDGNIIKTPKINPLYDPKQEYIPRENRPEWDPVGLIGRLKVRDDGTCKVGGLCRCGKNGIATSTNTNGFKVLKRITTNIIEILVK